jgi:predicted transcriptional regulator
MKNLHVPLPDGLDAALRAAAARRKQPATALAREAIAEWLERQRRAALHQAIAAYAAERAGGDADLDAALEAAGVERLLAEDER